jgi:hypothetical protein
MAAEKTDMYEYELVIRVKVRAATQQEAEGIVLNCSAPGFEWELEDIVEHKLCGEK